jgi:predicted TIM-barrel enzyme
MPNPWTGKGNPYTRKEVRERLMDTIKKGDAIIAAGAGTGISAKFIEKGGADLIIIYNSGRFRMMGHGSTCGMMAYGDANAIAMEIGEYEVLPVVEEAPVICGVHATDPRRRMWHWLGKVKEMGFSGVNNFPTHTIVDGHFRGVLEETGMSVQKEFEMVALARKMDLFSVVYVGSPEEAVEMAKAGADSIIAHVGTTVGGSIGVTKAVVSWDFTIKRTQSRAEGHLLPLPRRTDQYAAGCGSCDEEYRCRRLCRRKFARTHGCRSLAHEFDEGLQETEGACGEEVREEEKVG